MGKNSRMAAKDARFQGAKWWHLGLYHGAGKWKKRPRQPLQADIGPTGEPRSNRRRPLQDGTQDHDGVAFQAGNVDRDHIHAEWERYKQAIRKAPKGEIGHRRKALHAFVANLLAGGL